jgi:hypothetical protein
MTAPRKSKKQSNVSKKKEQSKSSIEEMSDPISKAEKINIERLIAQALVRHNKDTLVDQKTKHKELKHLSNIAEEYLSTFALIGYTLQNEQVAIFNMPSPKDEAALADLLRSTFIDIISNRP